MCAGVALLILMQEELRHCFRPYLRPPSIHSPSATSDNQNNYLYFMMHENKNPQLDIALF
jgi:hypothetical protein